MLVAAAPRLQALRASVAGPRRRTLSLEDEDISATERARDPKDPTGNASTSGLQAWHDFLISKEFF